MFDRDKELERIAELSSMSIEALSIILGSLLGDMCIRKEKSGINYHLSMRHSIRQKEYFLWKVNKLMPYVGGSWRMQEADGFSMNGKLHYRSRSFPSITTVKDLVFNKKKFVSRHWLNLLNDLALCIWYCDDGSLSDYRKPLLYTDSFSDIEIETIRNYFTHIGYNTSLSIQKRMYKQEERKYKRICISPARDFLLRIAKHIPCESMIYKFIIRYRDISLAQRWTSDLSRISGISEEIFNNLIVDKKKVR